MLTYKFVFKFSNENKSQSTERYLKLQNTMIK